MDNEQLKAKLKEAVAEYIDTHLSYRRWAISATSRGDKQAPIFKDIVQKHGIAFESIPKSFLNRVENYKAHCEMSSRPLEFGESNYDDIKQSGDESKVEKKEEASYDVSSKAVYLISRDIENITQEILEEVVDNPRSYNALACQVLTDHENIIKGNENEKLTQDQKLHLLRAMTKAQKSHKAPDRLTEADLAQEKKSKRFQFYANKANHAGEAYETGRGRYRRTEYHESISSILFDIKWDETFTKEEAEQVTALVKEQYEKRYEEGFKGVKNPFISSMAKNQENLHYDSEHCMVKRPTSNSNLTTSDALKYSFSLRMAQRMLEKEHGYNQEIANEINAKFENALKAADLSDEKWATVVGFHYLFPEEEIDKIIKYHEVKHYRGDSTFGRSHRFTAKSLKGDDDLYLTVDHEVSDAIFGIIDDPDFTLEDVLEGYAEGVSVVDILEFVKHLKETAQEKDKKVGSNNLESLLSSAGSQKGKGKSSIYE